VTRTRQSWFSSASSATLEIPSTTCPGLHTVPPHTWHDMRQLSTGGRPHLPGHAIMRWERLFSLGETTRFWFGLHAATRLPLVPLGRITTSDSTSFATLYDMATDLVRLNTGGFPYMYSRPARFTGHVRVPFRPIELQGFVSESRMLPFTSGLHTEHKRERLTAGWRSEVSWHQRVSHSSAGAMCLRFDR